MHPLVTVISAVLVFSFLIFIHEFGHYIFARIFKVTITDFSIGMGPHLVSYTSKKTKIKYSISMFPIGGYVAMSGETAATEGTEEYESWKNDPNTFDKKPAWQRFIITAAGAVVNIVAGFLAVLIISFMLKEIGGTSVTKTYIHEDFGTEINSHEVLMVGDEIISVDGKRVHFVDELSYEIMRKGIEPVELEIIRGGERKTVTVQFPKLSEEGQNFGIRDFDVNVEEKNLGTVLKYAWFKSCLIVRMCWESVIDLITGRYSLAAISGPVGISTAIGAAAASKQFVNVLNITALISINLGLMNLIPFPALDGGRLITVGFEMITRKRIPAKIESTINLIGLALLLTLSAVILVKDVIQLIF